MPPPCGYPVASGSAKARFANTQQPELVGVVLGVDAEAPVAGAPSVGAAAGDGCGWDSCVAPRVAWAMRFLKTDSGTIAMPVGASGLVGIVYAI